MRALSQVSVPAGPTSGIVIGGDDDACTIHRIAQTSGLYEMVRPSNLLATSVSALMPGAVRAALPRIESFESQVAPIRE